MNTDNADNIHCKQTIMLAYGYVTLYAPITLVTSRIEAVVFRNISPSFAIQKVSASGCLLCLCYCVLCGISLWIVGHLCV